MPPRERLAEEIARCHRLMAGVNDAVSAERLGRYARELDDLAARLERGPAFPRTRAA